MNSPYINAFNKLLSYLKSNIDLQDKITIICDDKSRIPTINVLLNGQFKIFQEYNIYGFSLQIFDYQQTIKCTGITIYDQTHMKEIIDTYNNPSYECFFCLDCLDELRDTILECFNDDFSLEEIKKIKSLKKEKMIDNHLLQNEKRLISCREEIVVCESHLSKSEVIKKYIENKLHQTSLKMQEFEKQLIQCSKEVDAYKLQLEQSAISNKYIEAKLHKLFDEVNNLDRWNYSE